MSQSLTRLGGLFLLLAWLGVGFAIGQPATSLKLAPLFADHAVLQRAMPVPIWGWAPDGQRIEITV